MARYDQGWGHGMGRRPLGYGHQYRDWDAPWGMGSRGVYSARGPRRAAGREGWGFGGYGYGGSYPQFGGYPGSEQGGMYYGGRYDTAPGFRGPAGGYDRGGARQAFLPEEAYRRHPEFERPPRHAAEWGDRPAAPRLDMDDEEVRRSVRESLFNDSWVPADRIQVAVNGGVVTLSGEVSDYLEARYAWDDAWETPGVRGVINQLTVRTDQPASGGRDVLPQTE